MAWGLPKLPGMTFTDPTKTQFNISSSLKFYQGYRFPQSTVSGTGGAPTDADSNAFSLGEDSVTYDPSLTYGRVKQPALPQVIPHWVHYDKRCLNFTAFMKQPVYDNPLEKYRLRIVNIIYFLEDDSITIIEKKVPNSGLWQGRMVKRDQIPKNDQGDTWHWKDLNVGKDIAIHGKVFHTVACDLYTKEWLESQGIEVAQPEDLPTDAFMEQQKWASIHPPKAKQIHEDKLRRYLEYDGKVLAFSCVWDNRDSEYGELAPYKMLYFLQDDTIAIKELKDDRGGKDPFPLLLKKTKLPKKWKDKPVMFPATFLETTDAEVTEYYAPLDLIIGETIFVFGRRFLLYDCDPFTRHYYKAMLNVEQPARIEVLKEKKVEFKKVLPPHIGIGEPEDSIGSCYSLIPKPPYKDVIKYNLNAKKNLRYLCELDWVHPEDKGREFVLSYCLGDGKIKIGEIPKRNSGIMPGRFLKDMKIQTPDSDPNFPTYLTPVSFYIGAIITVFKHRFKITGCDLYVYRYMSANPEKFPPEVIDNVRNYHMRQGNLKDELEEAVRDDATADSKKQLEQIGQSAVVQPTAMQRCLTELNVVEGSATPPRPSTPPMTTDTISYDETLRINRMNKPKCEDIAPLKGILKSGAAKDDHQKMVCFTGPETGAGDKSKKVSYAPDHVQFHEEDDYCEQYQDPGAKERAIRREREECPYEIIPRDENKEEPAEATEGQGPKGYLGTYGVECKKVPDYMKLPADAYDKVRHLRKEPPEISPAATRASELPRAPPPDVDTCKKDKDSTDPCAPRKEEDVAFACAHVVPKPPCCDPDKRVTKL